MRAFVSNGGVRGVGSGSWSITHAPCVRLLASGGVRGVGSGSWPIMHAPCVRLLVSGGVRGVGSGCWPIMHAECVRLLVSGGVRGVGSGSCPPPHTDPPPLTRTRTQGTYRIDTEPGRTPRTHHLLANAHMKLLTGRTRLARSLAEQPCVKRRHQVSQKPGQAAGLRERTVTG